MSFKSSSAINAMQLNVIKHFIISMFMMERSGFRITRISIGTSHKHCWSLDL